MKIARQSKTGKHRIRYRLFGGVILALLVAIIMLSGPAATHLQIREQVADPDAAWDAVYLVCGARAQSRRIKALTEWIEQLASPPVILVGRDPEPSRWSRKHQRNLTRTEWGLERLNRWKAATYGPNAEAPRIQVVPGTFRNTDGEVQALATFLGNNPHRRVAFVTSRFHARRVANRLATYAPDNLEFGVIPGVPYWENRAPWIVAGEYLKLFRDTLGHSQTPLLTRAKP